MGWPPDLNKCIHNNYADDCLICEKEQREWEERKLRRENANLKKQIRKLKKEK